MIARKPWWTTPQLGAARARARRTGAASIIAAIMLTVLALPASGASVPNPLPDPDGRPADMSKKVQVYILMGQSNMLNFGSLGTLTGMVKNNGKYPFLVDAAGNWIMRKDVRNVHVNNQRELRNEWMTIGNGNIGVEIGIGHYVGHVTEAPVLILKSATGNRSLGWDLLPPGSVQYEFGGKIYAGYKDSPESWAKGTTPRRVGWYAGKQYDTDIAAAKRVLSNLGKYYPGATRFQVAGFFYWQGDKDRYNAGHATRYEKNLVHLIKTLRKEFNAPNAFFVCATLGQTSKGAGGNEGHILNAQLAVDGTTGKYPEFRGNVASVYSKPFCHGGSSSGHYGGNPETYMDIGLAMGRAMAGLIVNKSQKKDKEISKKKEEKAKKAAAEEKPKPSAASRAAHKLLKTARDAERMRQRPIARVFYQKIIKDYPDTPVAEEAKKRLEKLE